MTIVDTSWHLMSNNSCLKVSKRGGFRLSAPGVERAKRPPHRKHALVCPTHARRRGEKNGWLYFSNAKSIVVALAHAGHFYENSRKVHSRFLHPLPQDAIVSGSIAMREARAGAVQRGPGAPRPVCHLLMYPLTVSAHIASGFIFIKHSKQRRTER